MAGYRDTELLISEIEKRPAIWDTSTEEYKNKRLKNDAWVEVCRSVNPDYEEKSLGEKNTIGKELLSRWKSIRDSYTKYCKKRKSGSKSGSETVTFRRYIFADQLSFLDNVRENRETTDCLPTAHETQEVNEDMPISEDLTTVHTEPTPKPKKTKKSLQRERMVHFKEGHAEEKDADKEFLMSMLPLIQTLSEDQKIEFRIHTLSVLRSIKSGRNSMNPHLQQSSVMFPPIQQYLVLPQYLAPGMSCTNPFGPLPSAQTYQPHTQAQQLHGVSTPLNMHERFQEDHKFHTNVPTAQSSSTDVPAHSPASQASSSDGSNISEYDFAGDI